LVSNAIKYSPSGHPIEISAGIDSEQVVVAVEDHGIGIPAKDLDRLFERYHRGSNVSGIVGTGVGLYLVKMVVDLHGGTIAVKSKEGGGTRVTVRLPIKPPAQVGEVASAEAAPESTADAQRVEDHADH
jgi:two-component system, OmpR family, sensor kinase